MNSTMIKPLFHLAISTLLLSGCTSLTHTKFTPPQVDVPAAWQTQQVTDQVSINPWWERFNDPALNRLIQQMLRINNDLALATLTLQKARLEAGLSETDQYPELSSTLAASHSKRLDSGSHSKNYSANLSVRYELDLWGRVASSVNAAQWTAIASAADRESTAQSLASTTASLYWQIGYLKERVALSDKSIAYAKQILALAQRQYHSGAVSELDVLEAKRSLAGQQAAHSDLLQSLTEAENALAILFNQPPKQGELQIQSLPKGPIPDVAAGVPADLLIRRPDVKAALYELKSALATSDTTVAGYLPTLTLTSSVGDASSQLRHLLTDPLGTLGAEIILPFLQWNKMSLNRKIAQTNYQTALVNYRQTLYSAMKDVDNALSAKQHYQYQGLRFKEQYNAATAAEQIYASQYHHGAVSIRDWLDAQENQRSAQESLLENRYNQYHIQATLYQALGGSDIAPPLAASNP
ncbi:efflux transporter outer membrane subunit [Vibrio gazogenes]|uniref:Efflux transporter, outer membrane factor (OMF) lipoprotein, NodT family n=1 Tax=Vibrio gazogenes DSM 21264 = NBRC 103151 TaxID=1123492 RepID=A0A1M5HTZ2_VIBGA|nr:efflux transporter outer membrane subunit [Vibrio gazogenes]USP15405.1 efflux transporter outer membrane subunit [Vibrio gazogenes]SHG19358.1 efflux transporter, outer membrane factor (OMF) lipoprotein, NodT family [Vibrio gazogenes DSM 21264] [Vibrio gazogenes DSM 21264 = NBRC 103151]SJN59189.1 putative efflux pump outer membrane protein TtgC precursor [Vibrio gazogenes]